MVPQYEVAAATGLCDNNVVNCFWPGKMGTDVTFSLEGHEGKLFHIRSRLFKTEEFEKLHKICL